MTPIQTQFEILKNEFPDAKLIEIANGTALIEISNFPLPEGWSQDNTIVKFLAPVGYPFAKPDCFWVDLQLRLKNGAMPKNAQPQAIPDVPQDISGDNLWFSWHVGPWNPNRDNLSTFVRVIINRFKDRQ